MRLLSAQGTEERSQALNEAYATLTEMSAAELRAYARELRLRGPPGSTLKCAAHLSSAVLEACTTSGYANLSRSVFPHCCTRTESVRAKKSSE